MKYFFSHLLNNIRMPVIEIRKGEGKKTALMFLYFFLTIALIYILKPVRSSLFLGEFGAEKLPYIYIGEALWLVLVVWVYTWVARHVSRMTLYTGVICFMITNLLLLWLLFDKNIDYLSAFFYVWVSAFSITMTTVFWTLANDIFNPSEAKRLFGVIISGGSLGGILGGIVTNKAVQVMRTEDLLIIAVGILLVCVAIILFLRQEINGVQEMSPKTPAESPAQGGSKKKSSIKLLKGSSYLMMLAAIVIIAKVSSTIVDAQFNKVVELSIVETQARTAYFGAFWAWLNGISFCMQFFVTSFLLRSLGIGFSLWILPTGLGILSFASVLFPTLWMSQTFRVFDGSANYSVQLASKETLYLPLSSALRHKVKPIIDMLGFRTAKALGGVYILAVTFFFGLSYERLGILVLSLVPLWAVIAWKMRKAYSRILRSYLLNKKKFDSSVETSDALDVMSFLHDEKNFEEIKKLMSHRSSYARKLAAAASFTYERSDKSFDETRKIMQRIVEREAHVQNREGVRAKNVLRETDAEFLIKVMGDQAGKLGEDAETIRENLRSSPEDVLMRISELIRDPETGLETKRHAIRILEYVPCQETVDLLMHRLAGCQEHGLRFMMAKALLNVRKNNPRVVLNRFLVKSEIAREMTLHEQITKLRAFYRKQKPAVKAKEDYVDITMGALLDENLERVFQYLKLLYPGEVIASIYEEMLDGRSSSDTRAHAVELLANTVEPDLLIMIQSALTDGGQIRWKDREIRAILQSFMQSQDQWFTLIALYLATDLNLKERWPEISESQDPFSTNA